MRERHFPRLCGSCRAPMARQSDRCWRCGTAWLTEASPPTKLRVLRGQADAPTPPGVTDADRRANDDGSSGAERHAGPRPAARTG
jgi:hypothetical protein